MSTAPGHPLRPRRRAPLPRIAVLVVALLALLGAGAGLAAPASAAPSAVLKIADETVPVPSGFTRASWDCACTEPVKLIRYDYGSGSTTPVQTVVSSNGPSVADVALSGFEIGHVYRFSLVSQDGPYRYADAGPVVTVEGRATHPADDLLGTPTADRHGISVTVRTATPRPAVQFVTIGTRPPVATPTGPQLPPDSVVASASSGGAVRDLAAELTGLTPSTRYFYVVRAVDATLGEAVRTGQVDTLERVVDVTFQKIVVDDDSDDLSSGEIEFAYYVDKKFAWHEPEHDLSTGDTMDVPFTRRWIDDRAGDNAPVIARVDGHDDDGVTSICLWAYTAHDITPRLGETARSDSCGDGASSAVGLPVLPADTSRPESFQATGVIRTTQGSLKYTAHLSYRVFYW